MNTNREQQKAINRRARAAQKRSNRSLPSRIEAIVARSTGNSDPLSKWLKFGSLKGVRHIRAWKIG